MAPTIASPPLNVHVLDRHALLAFAAVALQGFGLHRVAPQQLDGEGSGAGLLRDCFWCILSRRSSVIAAKCVGTIWVTSMSRFHPAPVQATAASARLMSC